MVQVERNLSYNNLGAKRRQQNFKALLNSILISSWKEEVQKETYYFQLFLMLVDSTLRDKADSFPVEKQLRREYMKSIPLVARDPVTQAAGQICPYSRPFICTDSTAAS